MQTANHLAESFAASKAAMVTGVAGAAAAVTPPEKMASVTGDWLILNGVGVLSYAEIISVIGGMWVLCLLVDRAIVGIKLLVRKWPR